MSAKRKNERSDAVMRIMPLGAGQEVGRSCVVLSYRGMSVMMDCGVHPAYQGSDALPFFDESPVDLEKIDILLITHFHLDHCGSLPYLTERTGFKGKVYMTHPTKAVVLMLLKDYLRVSNIAEDERLYNEAQLNSCFEKIVGINFHQEIEHNGIKFKSYMAGHVLGAAMFMIEMAGTRVLYTGDYSLEEDRHLAAAEVPKLSPDVLIVESTYGVQVHEPRLSREKRFVEEVRKIVMRGGNCLIPVFALGRAQELLLILDEYWIENEDLHDIPVYYASKLASKALKVHKNYIDMQNDKIRQRHRDEGNPWDLHHINNLQVEDLAPDVGPSVVIAVPGFLQSGASRTLFDRWCGDEKNGVIIAGYAVEGTLARKILKDSTKDVTAQDGRIQQLNCSVEYISFSAHADGTQTCQFVKETDPPNIVLVHGDRSEMERLAIELRKQQGIEQAWGHIGEGGEKRLKPPEEQAKVFTPPNGGQGMMQLEFKGDRVIKAVGQLGRTLKTKTLEAAAALERANAGGAAGGGGAAAGAAAEAGGEGGAEAEAAAEGAAFEAAHLASLGLVLDVPVDGVMVSEGLESRLMSAADVPSYTQLCTASVVQQQHISFYQVRDETARRPAARTPESPPHRRVPHAHAARTRALTSRAHLHISHTYTLTDTHPLNSPAPPSIAMCCQQDFGLLEHTLVQMYEHVRCEEDGALVVFDSDPEAAAARAKRAAADAGADVGQAAEQAEACVQLLRRVRLRYGGKGNSECEDGGAIDAGSKNSLSIEWVASAVNDMVADSVVALIMQVESSPASVKLGYGLHSNAGSAVATAVLKAPTRRRHRGTTRPPVVGGDPELGKKSVGRAAGGGGGGAAAAEPAGGGLFMDGCAVGVKAEGDAEMKAGGDAGMKAEAGGAAGAGAAAGAGVGGAVPADVDIDGDVLVVFRLLREQFGGSVSVVHEEGKGYSFALTMGAASAAIDYKTMAVQCDEPALRQRLVSMLTRVQAALRPVC
jgi:Cft2 family RNA processing exonuclease